MTHTLILQIRTAIMVGCLTLLAAIALWVLCGKRLANAVRSWSWPMRFGMLAVCAGLSMFAVSKHALTIQWDDYLQNSGSHFNTNTWAEVTFQWVKTAGAMPDSQPLYISKKPFNFGSTWELAATTTVGGSPYTLQLANCTNYQFYVWHEWMPPQPVYTNGVWLGNVVERSKGTDGNDKLVIVNGYIQNNGVKIAPKKGNE